MRDGGLSTELYVSAHQRMAAVANVPMLVIRRGDASSGAIILKINLLNGQARVLIEARYDDKRVWTPATSTDPMPERDADEYMRLQENIDPDAWLIEIEDKQGRVWFPGKIV